MLFWSLKNRGILKQLLLLASISFHIFDKVDILFKVVNLLKLLMMIKNVLIVIKKAMILLIVRHINMMRSMGLLQSSLALPKAFLLVIISYFDSIHNPYSNGKKKSLAKTTHNLT